MSNAKIGTGLKVAASFGAVLLLVSTFAVPTYLFLIGDRDFNSLSLMVQLSSVAVLCLITMISGCACLQIAAAKSWPTPMERERHLRGLWGWVMMGLVTVVFGLFFCLLIPPVGLLLVIGGVILTGNFLAARITGLSWKGVSNAVSKSTVGVAVNNLVGELNPVKFEAGEIKIEPELVDLTPQFDDAGRLEFARCELLDPETSNEAAHRNTQRIGPAS